MNLLRGTFRLSIVVAALSAAWAGYHMLEERSQALQSAFEMKHGYECGARIEDALLERNKNDVGNINIGKLGCASRDFIVSMDEIRRVRSEGYDATFGPTLGTQIDWTRIAITAALGFLATNLLGLAFLLGRATYRWILSGFKGA